jgi:hypothetical protein
MENPKALVQLLKSAAYLMGIKMSDEDMQRYSDLISIMMQHKDNPKFRELLNFKIDSLIEFVKGFEASVEVKNE